MLEQRMLSHFPAWVGSESAAFEIRLRSLLRYVSGVMSRYGRKRVERVSLVSEEELYLSRLVQVTKHCKASVEVTDVVQIGRRLSAIGLRRP